jgi:hypothetical protein
MAKKNVTAEPVKPKTKTPKPAPKKPANKPAGKNPRRTPQERALAKHIFVHGSTTIKELSVRMGITEKTLGKWALEDKWDDMRKSLLVTKDEQIRRILNIIDNLNTKIERSGEKKKDSDDVDIDGAGDPKLADMLIKYTTALKNLQTELGITERMETCQELISFAQANYPAELAMLINIMDAYITNKMR